MPAYVVVSIEVNDPEGYGRYIPAAGKAIMAHGGEVLAADQATQVLEGPARPVTVLIKFPDKAAADAWYHSDDYQAAARIRHASTDGTMVIADGLVPPGS